MIGAVLLGVGIAFAITSIVLLVKRIGDGQKSSVNIPGLGAVETGSSALIIFVVSAGLMITGAKLPASTIGAIEKEESRMLASPFILSAGQVMPDNVLGITLRLQQTRVDSNKTATIRIWRNIENIMSDTAALDPLANRSGEIFETIVIGKVTPVIIPGVGNFKFFLDKVVSDSVIRNVQVTMQRQ